MSVNGSWFLYPVASSDVLSQQFENLASMYASGMDMRSHVRLEHPSFAYSPELNQVGGTKVTAAHLKELQNKVASLIDKTREGEFLSFATDADFASLLHTEMRVHPAQIEDGLMWATLATFILPEYVLRRFPKISEARFGATRRNALHRLWFRREAFTLELEEKYEHILDQDSVQQTVERPLLSSDKRLVELLLEVTDESVPKGVNHRLFFRDLAKQATYLTAVSIPGVMPEKVLKRELLKRAANLLNESAT